MKRRLLFFGLAALVVLATTAAVPVPGKKFVAVLRGANEVPARRTAARGSAQILWSAAGELRYRLIVAGIENVTAAHIHCAESGLNGPVGLTLFMGTAGSGPFSGTLAEATAAAPDAGNACGWADLGDVVAAMQAGGAYVNVHTNDGVDPANSGPGDFPGGEIRGQIRSTPAH